MEFNELVRKRRMVRHFTQEPVEPEIIERMLKLAQRAPSAGFTQGQTFIVVTRPELKQELARLCEEGSYVGGKRLYSSRELVKSELYLPGLAQSSVEPVQFLR